VEIDDLACRLRITRLQPPAAGVIMSAEAQRAR
jgi:hypothetical protein